MECQMEDLCLRQDYLVILKGEGVNVHANIHFLQEAYIFEVQFNFEYLGTEYGSSFTTNDCCGNEISIEISRIANSLIS